MRVLDRHVGRVARDGAAEVVGLDDIERLEIEPAVDVDAELEPGAAEALLRAALDVEVLGRDVGALDAAPRGRRGIPILIGALVEGAEESGDGHLLEPATVSEVVGRREAVRVLVGVVEAHRARVVPRPLHVPAEIALPPGRQHARAELVIAADDEAAVLPT